MHALTGSVTVPTDNLLHVGGNCASVVALLMQVVQPDVVLVRKCVTCLRQLRKSGYSAHAGGSARCSPGHV